MTTPRYYDYAAIPNEVEMTNEKYDAPFSMRVPNELKLWLGHKAVDNHRSLSGEIIFRLEQSRKAEEAQHEKQA